MPLSPDDPNLDYDGSWREASEAWPKIIFPSESAAKIGYKLAQSRIPYGSYVLIDKELRLETEDYKKQVLMAIHVLAIGF